MSVISRVTSYALIAAGALGCREAPWSQALTVEIGRTGSGSGRVTSDPTGIDCGAFCGARFRDGTSVTLTATPDPGSSFSGWSGACSGLDACIVSLDRDRSVKAEFRVRVDYALSVHRAGSGTGTVTSMPAGIDCGGRCTASVEAGTEISLEALSDGNASFASWVGDCDGAGPCRLRMDGPKSVTAEFRLGPPGMTLQVQNGGGGTVTSSPAAINCGTACAATFLPGTVVTLTAAPAPNFRFSGWFGECRGTGTCTVTLDAPRQVFASFASTQLIAWLSVYKQGSGSGTVTSAPVGIDCGPVCWASFPVGAEVTVTATPGPDSAFAGWIGGNGACSGTGPCRIALPGWTWLSATFNTSVVVEPTGTGAGTVVSNPPGIDCGDRCRARLPAGTSVTLTATPDGLSYFNGWTGACWGMSSTCTVMVDAVLTRRVVPAFGSARPPKWSRRFGALNDDVGRAVAADGSGNVVVAGSFTGAVDFGGSPLAPGGGRDAFVAAYDAAGRHRWSRAIGRAGSEAVTSVAVGPNGDVVVGGYFTGTVDLGAGTSAAAGFVDAFVVRYGADGTYRSSRAIGGPGFDAVTAVAVDASGDAVVAGVFEGTVDAGSGDLWSAGSRDGFVAKYAPNGTAVFTRRFGGAAEEWPEGVAAGPGGAIAVAGRFAGVSDFGLMPVASGGQTDAFLLRLTPAGAPVWSRNFGGAGADSAVGVAFDAAGEAVVAGYFAGSADFGGGAMAAAGSHDLFLAKYGDQGEHRWSRRTGGKASEQPRGVAVDGGGGIAVAGVFQGDASFGGATFHATPYGQDLFVARYTAQGTHLWSRRAGSSGLEEALGVAVGAGGDVWVTGSFANRIDLGGAVLNGSGLRDVWLANFGP